MTLSGACKGNYFAPERSIAGYPRASWQVPPVVVGTAAGRDAYAIRGLPARSGSASATARIEPVGLPSTVARVEGLVGKRHLPGATNAVDAAKATRLHQVN